jgi:hypothetical protein
VPSVSLAALQVLHSGGEEAMGDQGKTVGKGKIERELADVGWETDGSFSKHPAIGNSGYLCVLVPRSTWEPDEPAYELYDADKNLSYWVHEIPTPEQAAKL